VPGIEAHLFGSALSCEEPRDIDLLLIYDLAQLTVNHAIEVRKRICDALVEATDIPADIVLLSTKEAEETQFLKKIHSVRIF
jgi:predicted nucleotidyltransferase